MIRTVSPVFAEFSSSCAFTRLVRVTIFPYTGCGTRRSIATTTVFCILSLTTVPVRTLRALRAGRSPADVVGCWFVVMSAMVARGAQRCLTAHARTLAGPARRRLRRRQLPLTLYRLEARDVAADRPASRLPSGT